MVAAVQTSGGSSGGRPTASRPSGPSGRVADAQREARRSLAVAVVFALAAPISAVVPHDTGTWLPLHLLLAGAMTLAISGVAPLLAVGWSAGPAAPARMALLQRWLLAGGVSTLALGRELAWPAPVLGVGGSAVLSGLVLLAVMLAFIGRGRVERRFDGAYRSYFAAIAASAAAATLGLTGVLGAAPAGWRDAHVALTLLGLLGLVIAGTLPFFVATQARTVRPARASVRAQDTATAVLGAGVALAAAGSLLSNRPAEVAGFVTYAAGIGLVLRQVPWVRWPKARWAGPRLVQIYLACGWWLGSALAAASRAAAGDAPLAGDVLLALGVGAYAQLLVASLAYLGPVLRGGGHERLAGGFAATRSWLGLVAANVGLVLLLAGWMLPAAAVIGLWVADALWRAARLSTLVRR